MNTNIENISDTRKKIAVSFDAAQVASETQKITDEFVRNAKVSGFRPGKAPKPMVEKLYSKNIADQVERSLTSQSIEALNGIKDFDLYAVVDVKKDEADGGVTLTFIADVYPDVKLPDSLETKVELESDEATDEEVEKAIEYHRNQRAKYDEVSRPIVKGDFVRLAYSGKLDGEPLAQILSEMPMFGEQKSTWEEAGNADAPGVQGIVQGIIGMSKGEKKTLSHEFPKEFPNEKVAGKTAEYEVEIQEVRQKSSRLGRLKGKNEADDKEREKSQQRNSQTPVCRRAAYGQDGFPTSGKRGRRRAPFYFGRNDDALHVFRSIQRGHREK